MQGGETRSDGLLDLILLSSIRERRALCGLALAAYRVELTAALHRIADGGIDEEEAFLVYDLAERIAAAATAARLSSVRSDALLLQEKATEVHEGSDGAEVAMLAVGLRVIDAILDSARVQSDARAASASSELN